MAPQGDLGDTSMAGCFLLGWVGVVSVVFVQLAFKYLPGRTFRFCTVGNIAHFEFFNEFFKTFARQLPDVTSSPDRSLFWLLSSSGIVSSKYHFRNPKKSCCQKKTSFCCLAGFIEFHINNVNHVL